MDAWQSIFGAVLANAVALTVLGLLGRSLLANVLARDSKRFEIELKAKADQTIEQLKTELQMRTIEHQVTFSNLHEKQATVVADLYSHMVITIREAGSFLSPLIFQGEPDDRARYQQPIDKLRDLYLYFDVKGIYLPAALCADVEKFVSNVRSYIDNFGVYLAWEDRSLTPSNREAKLKARAAGWTAINDELLPVRLHLEREFRALLGHSAA